MNADILQPSRFAKLLVVGLALAVLPALDSAAAQGGTAIDAGPNGPQFYIKLFILNDRKGRSMKLTANTPSLGIYNGRTSSVQAYGRWRLCTQASFTGTCKVVDHSAKNLAMLGLDNKLVSVQFVGGE